MTEVGSGDGAAFDAGVQIEPVNEVDSERLRQGRSDGEADILAGAYRAVEVAKAKLERSHLEVLAAEEAVAAAEATLQNLEGGA